MLEVELNVELLVGDIGNHAGVGDGLGVESSPLGLGLVNELLLLLVLGISHLLLGLRVEGSVVHKSVDNSGTEGGPSQNVESGRHGCVNVVVGVGPFCRVVVCFLHCLEVKYDNARLANGSGNISRVTNSIKPRGSYLSQGGWLSKWGCLEGT